MTNKNNLELNAGDDFFIIKDRSTSMKIEDCPGGLSRSAYVDEQSKVFAQEAAKYDTDGVTVIQFGVTVQKWSDIPADQLDAALTVEKYEPATMTHLAIKAAWDEHKERGNEQSTALVFTDGEPSDPNALLKQIAAITNEVQDEREFNIAFLTVGVRSAALEAFLTTLDDGIPGAKYDIVDVKRQEEVDFYEAFAGAVDD